ncbi:MAG: hypothetical protein ACRD29_23810 [Acidimicrobiales bacterium]
MNTGNDQRARAHLSRAFRLARAAGNPALIGNVCGSMSHLARQLDQPDHAVRLAEVGLQHASGIDGVAQLVARLHASRARALSHQGAIGACLAALNAAEQALETGETAVVEWVSPFDAGSLASDTAVCLRAIGDLSAAERHARRAIELRPGDRVRSRALARLTLAEVLIDVDRIDEAATTGQQVCEAAQSLNSTQVLRRLDGLGSMLEAHASLPVVASFLAALTVVRERAARTREADDSWPT